MTHPNLQRDVTYLDLVSELRADPAGMGKYARELVEATGAGTIRDADRALTVLTHRDPDAFAWDRPLTRQDQEDRKKAYEECIRLNQGQLKKGLFGVTPEDTVNGVGGVCSLTGMLLLLMAEVVVICALFGGHWAKQNGVAILCGGIASSAMMLLLGVILGPVLGQLDQKRHPHLRAQVKAAQSLLEEESVASVSDREAERWLAFPEVARQARRWIRSSPGLMKRDVELLDARLAELHAAEEAHRKGSLLRRLVGWVA